MIAVTLLPGCADDGPVPPLAPDPLAAEIRDLIQDLFAGDPALTLAGPGKLGGAISSVSPFAAVDPSGPTGSAPLDITVEQVSR